jgi:hypothetical protein
VHNSSAGILPSQLLGVIEPENNIQTTSNPGEKSAT